MSHIDPERLALLALGESALSTDESEHLAQCAVCVDDLAALRHAALAGRASLDVGELETPPEVVWQRISAEVGLAAPVVEAAASAPVDRVLPAVRDVPLARHRRRVRWGAWALAAALVLVAGVGLGTWAALQRSSSSTEIAEALLAPFPTHDGAEGSATVQEQADGSLSLKVQLSAEPTPDTYREVWLITADASALVSLGVLDGTSATFAVPSGVDLRDYVLVDVSQEPVDGDPAHSGDSIVRGELTFL
ncbi:anti-sigma factor [Microbacterium pygmaeum]|uniref:Anti-sigma-K factor rskA n=1 Tax=Microbacterium pygmaeum TaxID=370764 RepID=A0A1G7ZT51_9MICO|nr:anti-sigma factor [Microbacterium pygmaeum]SDH11843.1 Anti-sigma-K factor rskA [Microbacterium pygmaeum]